MTQSDSTISEPASEHNQPAQADAVLVLGMHRSGTSALARVLNLMGVELGSDLLPAAADNEAGFWEHRQIQFIHDRIYESLHLDWTNVSPLPDQWWNLPEVEPFRRQLRDVLKGDFGSLGLWGVKDPRICAMMPLWRSLLLELNVQPRCVLIVRNPVEVAASLARRDGHSLQRVHLLWLRSIIDAERGSRGLPRTITTFAKLLEDWRGEVRRIEKAVGLQFPKDVETVADDVAQFIRPSLRHHQMTDSQLLADQSIPSELRRLYAGVLRAVESGEMSDLSQTVDIVAAELDKSHPLLSQFIQSLEQEHRNTVIEKNKEQVRLDAEVTNQHKAALAAAADAASKAAQLASLNQQLLDQQASAAQEREAAFMKQEALRGEKQTLLEQVALYKGQVEHLLGKLNESYAETAAWQKHAGILQESLTHHANAYNAERAAHEALRGELDAARSELSQYQIQRMILLRVLELMRKTRRWRLGEKIPGQRQVLSAERLMPISAVRKLELNRWECDGVAQFALPCLPMQGKIRVELKMKTSVPGHARLYFDTGHLFNPQEHLDLGPVDGEVSVEREITLPGVVHCYRLDPLDRSGEFSIFHFGIISL